MGTVWVRCPLTTANQLSAKGHLKIGWALVRVELLENRPLQCYRCLEGGHVRARCPNNTDRSGNCYRCGQDGDMAKDCMAPVLCVVCKDRGLPSNHRMGGKACAPVQKGKRGVSFDRIVGSRKETKGVAKPATAEDSSPREGEVVLRDMGEPPKERRTPKTRAKRLEGKEEAPNDDDSKRQRLTEALIETPKDAMDLATDDANPSPP